SGRGIVATTLGLWLFAMAVVMPVTGAGFFATALFQDVPLINASYLGMALAYATVLLAGRWLLTRVPATPRVVVDSLAGTSEVRLLRRSFIGTLAGAGVAYAATLWLGRNAGASSSNL